MKIFDYIYYRWFTLYSKKDSDPDIYASGIVSAYQLLTIINIVLICSILFEFKYPKVHYLYPFIIVFFIINYFRYERNFDINKLEEKWGKEPISKRKRNWFFLILYLVSTFITPWVYGYLSQ